MRNVLLAAVLVAWMLVPSRADEIRVATFDVDASPPVGSPLAYDPTKAVTSPLSCRGVVIVGVEKPIVLCSVDWLGIANASHTEFCERLAKAAGTTPDRVSVHTIHQHDAPRCDFSAKEYLDQVGLGDAPYDERFCRSVFLAASEAVADAIKQARPVTHVGLGEATVEKVASNRRILGDDGKVEFTRYTACRDPKIRAMPVGTIDPKLKMISFWNDDKPLAVLTYYATHPQSYYRTGGANPDFPGMARNDRQKQTGVPHIHFNGAGGNIGAGKWNDGSKENRQVLARRVELGMKQAWEATKKTAVTTDDIRWKSVAVALPPGPHLVEDKLRATLKDESLKPLDRLTAAKHLAWLKRSNAGVTTNLSCLAIGTARVLNMPGELFVEYQLAAQKMAPDNFVAMAAYGEYGPGYIGTKVAYSQGGYETSQRASRVSAGVEKVLDQGMRELFAGTRLIEIQGDIYDGDEEGDEDPLEGVLVRAFAAVDQFSEPKELARTMTDADGEFDLKFVGQYMADGAANEFGFCWLIATHPKHAVRSLSGSGWTGLTKHHSWPMFPRNKVFHGVVRDKDGHPIKGAVVHFEVFEEWVIPGYRSATTDGSGKFRMEGLYSRLTAEEEDERESNPRGWSYVRVSHPEYGTQVFKHVTLKSPVTWTLLQAASLEGSVVDQVLAQPAANTIVWFFGKGNNSGSARTDEAGRYRVLLPPDTYRISVRTEDRVYKDLIRTLKPGMHGKLLPISLTAGAIVKGRIVDGATGASYEPATNVKFQVWADGPRVEAMGNRRRYRSTKVREDGTYEIRLPAGEHRLRLAPRDMKKPAMTVEEGKTYDVDFVLRPIGQVRNPGQAIGGAWQDPLPNRLYESRPAKAMDK